MNKIFRLLALLVLIQVSRSAAQTSEPSIRSGIKTGKNGPWEINISANPGLSLYESRLTLGADLQVERYVTDRFAITFNTGFTHFFNRPYFDHIPFDYSPWIPAYVFMRNRDQNLIPLKLGIKVFPLKRIYLAGAAGVGFDVNPRMFYSDNRRSFLFSATAGIKLGNRFDLGIKYENYTDLEKTKQLSLRLGYRIF